MSLQIKLKPFNQSDVPELLQWLENTGPEFLMQFAGPGYSYPLDASQIYKTLADPDTVLFNAIHPTGNTCGHCQLLGIDKFGKTATVGRVLVPSEYRNLGLGYSMLKHLIHYAVAECSLRKLNLRVFEFNLAAIHCYTKLGFVQTSREDVNLPEVGQTWGCARMEYNHAD